jgi:hypothetical protein
MHKMNVVLGITLAVTGCAAQDETDADLRTSEVRAHAESTDPGCWVYGPMTGLQENVCGYSSAEGALGSIAVSGYWSSEHPYTCYLQVRNVPDAYDGGCDRATQRGRGTQWLMNYSCDGVEYSSGWLDSPLYDGFCDDDRLVTACSIRTRAPGC